ncbi:class F sortase, partial [Kitasatospora sp. NPDC002965]|uniref:class F sortase n=1 Tax=Kitasatospora sp. NPDC002965 TaxID=3154775 RepID=UPI0033B5ADE9
AGRAAGPAAARDGGRGRSTRGHRRPRSDGPGAAGLRRTAFGAAGLICVVLGTSMAFNSTRTPVVRVETSAREATGPAATAGSAGTGPGTGTATGAAATSPATSPTAAPGTSTSAAPRKPFAASAPTRLLVPAAGVDAPVPGLGLNADGTVEVPTVARADEAGWYRNGPTPGENGPAVLIGHYDTANGPAVFHRLPKLRPGDLIQVRREDGSTVDFRVRSLLQAAKDRFPTEAVYGDTAAPELRLITCGGRIGADGHWTDNIIVVADLADPAGPAG